MKPSERIQELTEIIALALTEQNNPKDSGARLLIQITSRIKAIEEYLDEQEEKNAK